MKKPGRNDFAGCKQMKAKKKITLMVIHVAVGSAGPLTMVGTPINPVSFKHEPGKDGKLPIVYKNQEPDKCLVYSQDDQTVDSECLLALEYQEAW
jgi:hypothetical protein